MNLDKIPTKTGVYLFKDSKNRVIYVGKAKNLRKRVSQYFKQDGDEKNRSIVQSHKFIEFIITSSEFEAFLLESNLIKKYKPRFNAILKDDKSYPFIKITREDFPRAVIVRKNNSKNGYFFGPFTSVKEVRAALDSLRGLFGVRNCRRNMKNKSKVCLQYHMKRCPGPCEGFISKNEYKMGVDQLLNFLRGNRKQLLESIESQMKRASQEKRFELAANLRDQLFGLKKILSKQTMVSKNSDNFDILGCARADCLALVQVLSVRAGRLDSERNIKMKNVSNLGLGEIIDAFCRQFYVLSSFIPKKIIVEKLPKDSSVEKFLSKLANHDVKFRVPHHGSKKDLLDLAVLNAREKLGSSKVALSGLKKLLGLKKTPRRIECFDISNIGNKWAAGSMVTFIDGNPDKSFYRRFKIRWIKNQDDTRMMAEVIGRRFSHPEWGCPDLVVLDGGKGQLSQTSRVLELMKINIPLIGLAKKQEEIFILGKKSSIKLPLSDPSLTLLRQVRDEAHRFAKKYHSKLRRKN